jgi:uncharacterized lipoprotein NlpE involved in copper resistance
MRKKILVSLLTVGSVVSILILIGCGNRQIVDTSYTFKKAIIEGVGTVEVSSWCDYDESDMVQVKAKDGTVYLTHSSNVILISK